MSDRLKKSSACRVTNGKQGNFVIELYKCFHDYTSRSGTTALLRYLPRFFNVTGSFDHALSVTRRAHNWFHHAGNANGCHRKFKFFFAGSKTIRRAGNAQLFGCQPANAFAVHGQKSSFGSRNYIKALLFQFYQSIGSNGFNLGNDIVRFFGFNNFAKLLAIKHRKHVRPMCHLHSRCVGIFVQRHYLDTITLQFDSNFFS